jgi:hypothetical protein
VSYATTAAAVALNIGAGVLAAVEPGRPWTLATVLAALCMSTWRLIAYRRVVRPLSLRTPEHARRRPAQWQAPPPRPPRRSAPPASPPPASGQRIVSAWPLPTQDRPPPAPPTGRHYGPPPSALARPDGGRHRAGGSR